MRVRGLRLAWCVLLLPLWVQSATAGPCISLHGTSACLEEADGSALGTRTPLILVHGWNNTAVPGEPLTDTWSNFSAYAHGDPTLPRLVKIYTFNYYSNVANVPEIGRALRDVIQQERDSDPGGFGARRLLLMGHSMGGLVARYFLRLAGDQALLLLTFGTPHHGSMLANGPAMASKAGALWGSTLQQLYDLFYPTPWYEVNRTDLFWDNFDGALDHSAFPSEQSVLLPVLNNDTSSDGKIIAYGGALGACRILSDQYCLGSTVIGGVFELANDGVVPLSSALFHTSPTSASSRFRSRYFPDYDHSQIARGRGDGALFSQIKTDLLSVLPGLTTIGGRVFDATNNRAISGATVEVLGAGLRTTTDGNGQYRLAGINAVTFTTRYSHPAYRTLDFEYTFRPGTERLDLVTGLTAAPSVYDGSWTGSGSGTSSGSTPASVEISFQVSGDQVTFNSNWTIQQTAPAPPGFVCPGRTNTADRITNNSFRISRGDDVYSITITGTFTSQTTVNGTYTLQRVGSAFPLCPSATINWTGRRQ